MRIAVYGAGGIGCYVGGRLAATGTPVTLIGRRRMGDELAEHGLHLTDYLGAELSVRDVPFETEPAAVADADLVLVTVKSAGTPTAADELAGALKPGAVVVSFQNGIRNGDILRERLPDQVVLSGMVPFNVLNRGGGAFHQGTSGGLDVQRHAALTPYVEGFATAGLPLTQHADILPVQWAKLLLNLNNPINALADVPLRDELSQRAFRRCLAAAQAETLALLTIEGIKPAQLMVIPPHRFPMLLRLPDFIYKRLASKTLAIDPLARTSMWEDLVAGRRTEIDYINGEVVRLAESLGREAPVNAKLVELIRAAEVGPRRAWSGPELLEELTRAG
ncbi:2-dehydropantoate 2-reductase [Kribbella qitaiheensis]|uniref:2-dehydropantoate 2-reductase n=1 Tax=Kribbella qitaiheensis TaxID=1544730 RepID=A0A7G6X4S5_9ACTN|nr:2-dehydropantoate 2-reductase [Kribbella qitaiheensis]QNE21240.1 2-dehydropantoate 2-reductase [Kribbella qitaiheensis]